MEVARCIKEEAAENDLLDRLASEPIFKGIALASSADPTKFIGLAPEQVDAFVQEVVDPIRLKYKGSTPEIAHLRV